jgi:hypothetical protein
LVEKKKELQEKNARAVNQDLKIMYPLLGKINIIRSARGDFYARGSVHRESTLKCSDKMTLFVQYFIPCEQPYMFREERSPIIGGLNKL